MTQSLVRRPARGRHVQSSTATATASAALLQNARKNNCRGRQPVPHLASPQQARARHRCYPLTSASLPAGSRLDASSHRPAKPLYDQPPRLAIQLSLPRKLPCRLPIRPPLRPPLSRVKQRGALPFQGTYEKADDRSKPTSALNSRHIFRQLCVLNFLYFRTETREATPNSCDGPFYPSM